MTVNLKQEVNLYQDQFRPKKELLSPVQCALILLLMIGAFGAFGWLQSQQVNSIEKQLADLEQRRQSMLSQISSLAAKKNERQKHAINDADIILKDMDLKARRELLATLSAGKYGTTEGFSAYLVALARQHIEGSWITGLSVQQGGEQLAVAGSVLQPELAPAYLKNLSNEAIFSGKRFGVLELNKAQSKAEDETHISADYINFIFRTSNDDVLSVSEIKNES